MSAPQLPVGVSDTLAEERGSVAPLLEANADRRQRADDELRAARQELQELLLRGQAVGMQVAEMARKGAISRDTAHRILKEAGEMSWKQKEAWAGEARARIPRGDHDQNEFRALFNMTLLKALGKNPEGVPQSVAGVIEVATRAIRTAGAAPFEPEYDCELLSLGWPA
jgi:hypothetical protein